MPIHATDHEVVVVGDGPAGAAAAAACADVGLDCAIVGQGRPWQQHLGVWLDEVPWLPVGLLTASRSRVVVSAASRREIPRSYGLFDNDLLREHLGLEQLLVRDAMTKLVPHRNHVDVELLDGSPLTARWVIDATGAGRGAPPAWQTAYGVVVSEDVVRSQFTTDAITLMDWSVTGDVPTFCYVAPVGDGWLVEETALAAREPVGVEALRVKLARRIGEGVVSDAEDAGRVDEVRIPMGLPIRRASGRVVPFGAAAGMIHPVSGYSVATALRRAPSLAQAIAAGSDPSEAVWPLGARRVRALHDYGLGALLRLGVYPTSSFFEAFFSLPVERWSPYLRSDSSPREVAAAMRGVFVKAPWSVRRRLARFDRELLGGLVRG